MRGCLRRRLLGLAVLHQFESQHQPLAAHVSDYGVFLLKLFQLAAEVGAHRVGILEKSFFFDEFDRGLGCHGRHGIAAKRGDRQPLIGSRQFLRGDGRADGRPVGHALRAGHDVGSDLPVFDPKPLLARTPKTRLNFIRDKESAVLFHSLKNYLEVFRWRRDEAAHSLDRFGDERGDLAACARLDQVFDVLSASNLAVGIFQAQRAAVAVRIDGVRDAHADDPGFSPGRLRRYALGQRRSAGIGVPEGHNVVRAGGHPGEQDGSLVGLGAGAGEKAGLQSAGSNLRDLFRKRHDRFIRVKRGKVLQPVDLRLDGARDLGICVPHGNRQDAAEKIQVLAPLDVPNVLHRAMVGYQRLLIEIGDRRPKIFLVLPNDFFAARRRLWLRSHGNSFIHGCTRMDTDKNRKKREKFDRDKKSVKRYPDGSSFFFFIRVHLCASVDSLS